ncbi:MAG: hypothetical protein QM820_04715 [Minicystis sp.]
MSGAADGSRQPKEMCMRHLPRIFGVGSIAASSLLAATPASAFKPLDSWRATPSDWSHESITRKAMAAAALKYFSREPTRSMDDATWTVVLSNSSVDLSPFIFSSSAHFDDENLAGGQSRLSKLLEKIVASLQNNRLVDARLFLGDALHTLQDFYSHSSWVEIHGALASEGTHAPFPAFLGVAAESDQTCEDCNVCADSSETNQCTDNLSSKLLTSGYFSLPSPLPKKAGKCSHGGSFDGTSDEHAVGGINKDTSVCDESPHSHLHQEAATAAMLATMEFLDDIKARTTEAQLRALFGLEGALVFVIDNSTSMAPIIDSVKDQVEAILDARIAAGTAPSDYILMAFSDPDVGPLTITHDPDEFRAALASFTTDGGGDDCPEFAQSGMFHAINAASFGSELFLFTDASAKDGAWAGSVAALASRKGIRIHPMLFGNCEGSVDPGYVLGAERTGGQLFSLQPEESGQITKLVEPSTRASRVDVLLVNDTLSGSPKTYPVPVDSTMRSVTFAGSGIESMKVTDPNGNKLSATGTGVTAITLSTGQVYSIDTPKAGIWKVTLDGDGDVSLSVSGDSALFLSQLHFVERGGRPGHEGMFPLVGLPPAGQPSALRARLTGAVADAQFELWSPTGKPLQPLSLVKEQSPLEGSTAFAGEITLPDGALKAYAKGTDGKGHAFQRVVPASIRASTVMVAVPQARVLLPGQTTTAVVTVKNLGAPGSFAVRATDTAALSTVVDTTISLGAGASQEVAIDFTVPAGTEVGTWDTLTVNVESTTNTDVYNYAITDFAVIDPADVADPPDDEAKQGGLFTCACDLGRSAGADGRAWWATAFVGLLAAQRRNRRQARRTKAA